MTEQQVRKKRRGGAVKKAPPGFFLAQEAQKILLMTQSEFQLLVARGELERVIPPHKRQGYYRKADVFRLGKQRALFYLQELSTARYEPTTFAQATEDDIEGIFDIVASLWGAEKATPVELRKSWYRKNNRIDYIVRYGPLVLGYINIMPYTQETLEEMMSGRKRGWDIRPQDILQFEKEHTYDLFIGIAVRQDVPHPVSNAARLIMGFFDELCAMAQDGIIVRRLYATSDQPDGIQLSQDLGFVREEGRPGDLFGRFVLDLETSESRFAHRYRDTLAVLAQRRHKKQRQGVEGPFLFRVATPGEIAAIIDIEEQIFGVAPFAKEDQLRLKVTWWAACPEVFHVLLLDGKVVGHHCMIALQEEKIVRILKEEEHPRHIQMADILPFEPGMELDIYVVVTGVDPRLSAIEREAASVQLVWGVLGWIKRLGERGVVIKTIYARSRMEDGIRLSEGLGFSELPYSPVNGKKLYSLDVQQVCLNQAPRLREYRQALEQWRKQHQ